MLRSIPLRRSYQDGVPIIIPHWGTGVDGVISYSKSGWVVCTMATNDPALVPQNLTYPPVDGQQEAEWAMIGKSTLAYSGRYAVFPTTHSAGRVEHGPLVTASVPNLLGTTMNRNYTLVRGGEGDFVQLEFGAGSVQSVLWWKRLD